jgi:hypothetical protein
VLFFALHPDIYTSTTLTTHESWFLQSVLAGEGIVSSSFFMQLFLDKIC